MKKFALKGFLKNNIDVSRTITATKMEFFVALVITFQPLSNFSKNTKIGTMDALNTSLDYCAVFSNLCWKSN